MDVIGFLQEFNSYKNNVNGNANNLYYDFITISGKYDLNLVPLVNPEFSLSMVGEKRQLVTNEPVFEK